MPTAPRVLIATRSPHKLSEIRRILSDLPLALVSPDDLDLARVPEEDDLEPFETFAENAMSKARHFHARAGLPTLADDSGLCVDALDGEPGVRTKRFAPEELAARLGRDEANNRHLLDRLHGVSEAARGARYRCAVAAVGGGAAARVAEGSVRGRIATAPRGTGGFGYDPLFVPEGETRSYAELPPEAKRWSSHRARAFRRIVPWLTALS